MATQLAGSDPEVSDRRGQAAITEQELNGADAGVRFEQVNRKGEAQSTGCNNPWGGRTAAGGLWKLRRNRKTCCKQEGCVRSDKFRTCVSSVIR